MKKVEIQNYSACKEAVDFRKEFESFEDAWENCKRGDWMLWIASKVEVDSRKLFLAKGKCAELVIHLMKDERSRTAVQAAIDYGNGKITKEELKTAAAAADAAAAKKEILLKCADICRDILTDEVLQKIKSHD